LLSEKLNFCAKRTEVFISTTHEAPPFPDWVVVKFLSLPRELVVQTARPWITLGHAARSASFIQL